ncbi:MAG: ABC-2 transporter permease, partial [Butyricicoccus sp.]|nr:ABC-2 transporter permease [Butyricicoccus sp.]
MRALLLKDILTLRKTLVTYIGFMVLYFAIGLYSDNSAFFLVFVILMCNMLPLNALAYDERFHWDRMGLCLPLPRRNMVLSK